MECIPVVVFDVGASLTRVGFSNSVVPTIFPTLTSRVNNRLLVGREAETCDGIKKYVIDGDVSNWDHMESIWYHGFKEIKTEPENHRVLLTYPYWPCTGRSKEKIAEIMFEQLNIKALHLTNQAVMSLYSYGYLTGLAVHSGFSETQVYPIYEGQIIFSVMRRGSLIGGQYLTNSLREELQKKGYTCSYNQVNQIKEKLLYIAEDPENETVIEDRYTLPDGQNITLAKEKYLIPEELFTPFKEQWVIPDLVYNTGHRCDFDLRKDLFLNIVLTGGNTMLPGFAPRLEKEVTKLCKSIKVSHFEKVVAPPNRQNSTWIGGTILASTPTFVNMCMTKEDYNEYGPAVVHTKFF